jgi:hypothetical protein
MKPDHRWNKNRSPNFRKTANDDITRRPAGLTGPGQLGAGGGVCMGSSLITTPSALFFLYLLSQKRKVDFLAIAGDHAADYY